MDRKEELLKVIGDDEILRPIVDDIVFLENQLTELKKLPFIVVNPKNPNQQRTTPAQKQYKELLQQYTNIIKVVSKLSGVDNDDDESPLRKWIKNNMKI